MSDLVKHIAAGVLNIAYLEDGPADGQPVILSHGFPYDVECYAQVRPILASAGCRVITPYLRGYGPTRFLDAGTLRSGQQASLAHDLLALMDALNVNSAILAGYDWGGRAGCIVSTLWPQRVKGLVTAEGYNLHNIARSMEPASPENEYRYWYQYYFHSERGRAGLSTNRFELCKLLWRLWSPKWRFTEAQYAATARSFGNPDFVDVVIHSYRHRYALVAGDPGVEATEERLAGQPRIGVSTIALYGDADGVAPVRSTPDTGEGCNGRFAARTLRDVGHNPPQEAPAAFADAILALR